MPPQYVAPHASSSTPFNDIFATVRERLLAAFCGPADVGVHSPSVQRTLFHMGEAVLAACPLISSVRLQMPNVHNLLFDLSRFGLTNENEVFYPIDAPGGLIIAELHRPPAARL
jgi:urate oxidase